MSANTDETKLTITIADGQFGREVEVEADSEGLYLEGPTIPWEWILRAYEKVLPKIRGGRNAYDDPD